MSEAEKVNKKSQDLTHEEYIQAADYWKQKDAQAVKMDRETLEKEVEAYIQENNTCALATGQGSLCVVRQWNIVIMMVRFGYSLKAVRSLRHWRKIRMYVLPYLISIRDLVI